MAVKEIVQVWDGKEIIRDNVEFLMEPTKKVNFPLSTNTKEIIFTPFVWPTRFPDVWRVSTIFLGDIQLRKHKLHCLMNWCSSNQCFTRCPSTCYPIQLKWKCIPWYVLTVSNTCPPTTTTYIAAL